MRRGKRKTETERQNYRVLFEDTMIENFLKQ